MLRTEGTMLTGCRRLPFCGWLLSIAPKSWVGPQNKCLWIKTYLFNKQCFGKVIMMNWWQQWLFKEREYYCWSLFLVKVLETISKLRLLHIYKLLNIFVYHIYSFCFLALWRAIMSLRAFLIVSDVVYIHHSYYCERQLTSSVALSQWIDLPGV